MLVGKTNALFQSAASSDALRALLQTRTTSIIPLKN
jgi:hypothetical protein